MNPFKSFGSSVLISLALVVSAYFVSNSLVKSNEYNRSVVVKGLAEREVEADLAIWPLKISSTSNNLNQIEADFENSYSIIHSFLKEKGFDEKDITKGIPSIVDAWANQYNNQKPANRYIGKLEITVRTKEINKLNAAISDMPSLIGKGVVIERNNYWESVEYIYTQLNDIKPSMIEESTKNARQAAEKFALDSDSKVGKIKTAYQGQFSITNRDRNSPDIKRVRVVSTVEFFLRD